MATASTNWVHESDRPNETSAKVAEKMNKLEKKRMRDGWRWIKLSPRTRVFVPCDKRGRPTKEGQKLIEIAKEYCL